MLRQLTAAILVVLVVASPMLGQERSTAEEAQRVFIELHNHTRYGTVTPRDYVRAAVAMRMTLATWDETGYTEKLQDYILNNETKIVEGPTADEIRADYFRTGIKLGVSEPEYVAMFLRYTSADRADFVEEVRAHGLRALTQEALKQMEDFSDRVAKNHSDAIVRNVGLPGALGIIGLYIGVAALAVSGPVGWGMAAFAIALGMADAMN